MEQHQVPPVRVLGVAVVRAVTGATPSRIRKEETGQPATQVVSDLLEIEHPAGASWAFHAQTVAVEVMVAFQRLDQQIIDREPHGAAPVGVAAEEAGSGFTRLVVHSMFLTVESVDVWPVAVDAGEGLMQ